MCILEAAMQAVVTHAIAIAVTRLLVQDTRNLGGEFVRVGLVWVLRVSAPEIGLGQDRRQLRAFRRRSGIVSRDAAFPLGSYPFGRKAQGYKEKEGQCQATVHDSALQWF